MINKQANRDKQDIQYYLDKWYKQYKQCKQCKHTWRPKHNTQEI